MKTDESFKKEIHVGTTTILLESAEKAGDTVVLFLPGISGKALSERFQPLVDSVQSAGLPIARAEIWRGEEDVMAVTLDELQLKLGEVISRLAEEGFKNIIAIGKSFGGGLVLSYHDPRIVKKILWAPALPLSEKGTLEEWRERKLGEAAQLSDIQLSKDLVATDISEICILHGTADTVIPLRNSEAIVAIARRGTLKVIEGADHSYKDPAHEKVLLTLTARALVPPIEWSRHIIAAVLAFLVLPVFIVAVASTTYYFAGDSSTRMVVFMSVSLLLLFLLSIVLWKSNKTREWFVTWLTLPF